MIQKIAGAILVAIALFITILNICKPVRVPIALEKEASFIPTDSIYFQIRDPLKVFVKNELILVPAGFLTDLGSLPRILVPFLPIKEHVFLYPAVLHDYLYTCPNGRTRKEIDAIFYSFLLERKASLDSALIAYWSVRAFGWMHFNTNYQCMNYLEIKND
ncbi:MAG: DUF1353 domain-containing protein [Bacteroidota bacterium]